MKIIGMMWEQVVAKIVPDLIPPKRYKKHFLRELKVAAKITENLKRGVK